MAKRKAFLGNRSHPHDPVWHVQAAIGLALLPQVALAVRYGSLLHDIACILEAYLLLVLSVTTPRLPVFRSAARWLNVIALVVVVGIINIAALGTVAGALVIGDHHMDGQELILTSTTIYVTNILAFGLLYWEMDGGGPGARRERGLPEHDFLFPQYIFPQLATNWHPTFIDYLYLAATNATALSSADTQPVSRRAKMLMLVQASVALVTLALVASRAVSLLA